MNGDLIYVVPSAEQHNAQTSQTVACTSRDDQDHKTQDQMVGYADASVEVQFWHCSLPASTLHVVKLYGHDGKYNFFIVM